MTLTDIITIVTAFVREHEYWALPVIFVLAFGESLAFLSLLFPATVILLGVGALIGEGGLGFWSVWLMAASGAFFGDWISYYVGYYYKDGVRKMWPISRSPQTLVKGHQFFEKWGVWGVFIGRFFGPLRAVIPLVAGICAMPQRYFQIANLLSAMVWAFGLLAPGAFGLHWIAKLMGT
ncbi:DedA family protein [Morganella psychrotolerans]|uniref:DedA family protein n=1 Tax=Morganella psychrotolerans TaxID=368603 RepID=A0A5M9QWY1_9GAMM|nr:DedA family protein [Morganella psychrotolerans]KAA8712661.1 DedA family protein [Morganella psychrotolerans]OBU06892.1 cytochrome O ubiquinol oxidase [Morganella psychrotolerans]